MASNEGCSRGILILGLLFYIACQRIVVSDQAIEVLLALSISPSRRCQVTGPVLILVTGTTSRIDIVSRPWPSNHIIDLIPVVLRQQLWALTGGLMDVQLLFHFLSARSSSQPVDKTSLPVE